MANELLNYISMNKKYIWGLFGLMVLAQWLVAGGMVARYQHTLSNGTAYKFKCAPRDPADFFRGRYVYLTFEQNDVLVDSTEGWNYGEEAFGILANDSAGFAKVVRLLHEAPAEHDCIKLEITSAYPEGQGTGKMRVGFQYPFTQYFMEEEAAIAAETTFRDALRKDSITSYGVVKIKNGAGILDNVMLGDISLRDAVRGKE